MDPESIFVLGRVGLSLALTIGGVVAIIAGYKLFRSGVGLESEGTEIRAMGWKITVGSVGGGLMLTALFWGWLATTTMPKTFKVEGRRIELTLAPELPMNMPFLVSGGSTVLECERKAENVLCFSLEPGAKCGAVPPFMDGGGRLQVGRSPASEESDRLEAVKNMEKSLRKVLADRGANDWKVRLMSYSAEVMEEKKVQRLVFNGVAPEMVQPMCTWLQCEGWTFGPCEFVTKDTK